MEIGPQLPNYLVSKTSHDPSSDCCHDHTSSKELETILGQRDVGVYGPKLPPTENTHKVQTNLDSQCDVDLNASALETTSNDTVVLDPTGSDELYGPQLPPDFKQKSMTIIGPCRPPVRNVKTGISKNDYSLVN